MKKYQCSYENSEMQVILAEKVLASSPREAYEKFIEKVGVQDEIVYVETGFFSSETFNDHVASVMEKQRELAEKKKKNEEEKAETSEHPQESADKENSNFDQPKIHAKLEDISATSTTEKLLLNIALTQEKQFQELEKLNYKLWSFWIFFIGLPILAWIIIAVNS